MEYSFTFFVFLHGHFIMMFRSNAAGMTRFRLETAYEMYCLVDALGGMFFNRIFARMETMHQAG